MSGSISSDTSNENEVVVERPSPEKCKWHKQLQNKAKTVRNIIDNHHPAELTDEAFKASRKLNKKFEDGEEWEKIKTFTVKPLVFKMRELQILVEESFLYICCIPLFHF